METSQAVVLVIVALALLWGWAVLCWTLRAQNEQLSKSLERQQEINAAQGRQIWTLIGSQTPERAQAASILATTIAPITTNGTGEYLDDITMSRM